VVDLPNTHLLCKVKTLNKGDANSEVTVYYQVMQQRGVCCLFPPVAAEAGVVLMSQSGEQSLASAHALGSEAEPRWALAAHGGPWNRRLRLLAWAST